VGADVPGDKNLNPLPDHLGNDGMRFIVMLAVINRLHLHRSCIYQEIIGGMAKSFGH
jgi:hypothetical protein